MRLGKVDPSSFSEPEKVLTTHVALNWTVDFERQVVRGSAKYNFKLLQKNQKTLLLDVRDISISEVLLLAGGEETPVKHTISDEVAEVGSKLTLELPSEASGELIILIKYETSSKASALQWLTPDQTLGKKHPYLFSQCQAIHARSILPCQDTPSVKFTYSAVISHPENLVALMSAIRVNTRPGQTSFDQTVPVPSYLLAIAVGDLVSRPLGPNSSVWAEREIVAACASEFSETCEMLKTASDICGPYVWKQYDLLVMPPSFPFGGMENPCLTFVTPTLLAGDKSLADVVAHEIAHSWTGNLVTNKNFEHFWLNEGFTVFVEGKIVGRMKGNLERDFHAIRNLTNLQENLRTQLSNTPDLTKLVVDLSDCSPDDAFSSVPYIKGSTFLRYIEDLLGGPEVFEPFLKFYLNKFKFHSIETSDFKNTLIEYFQNSHADQLKQIDWDQWLNSTGMPYIIPKFDDSLGLVCQRLADLWATKYTSHLHGLPELEEKLSPLQLLDFLAKLIEHKDITDLSAEKINLLEKIYKLNETRNSEIRFCFLRLAIRARLMDRLTEILAFANSNFRMKFVRPIYRDLAGWPEAKHYAVENFNRVKNQMMRVCSNMVEKDLELVN